MPIAAGAFRPDGFFGSACVALMRVFFIGLVSAWINYDILNTQVYSFDQSDELRTMTKTDET